MQEIFEVLEETSKRGLEEISLNRQSPCKRDNLFDSGEGNRTREWDDWLDELDWISDQTIETGASRNQIDVKKTSIQVLTKGVTDCMLKLGVQRDFLPKFIIWRGSVHLVDPEGEFMLIDWFSNWMKSDSFYRIIEKALGRQDASLTHDTATL